MMLLDNVIKMRSEIHKHAPHPVDYRSDLSCFKNHSRVGVWRARNDSPLAIRECGLFLFLSIKVHQRTAFSLHSEHLLLLFFLIALVLSLVLSLM